MLSGRDSKVFYEKQLLYTYLMDGGVEEPKCSGASEYIWMPMSRNSFITLK